MAFFQAPLTPLNSSCCMGMLESMLIETVDIPAFLSCFAILLFIRLPLLPNPIFRPFDAPYLIISNMSLRSRGSPPLRISNGRLT